MGPPRHVLVGTRWYVLVGWRPYVPVNRRTYSAKNWLVLSELPAWPVVRRLAELWAPLSAEKARAPASRKQLATVHHGYLVTSLDQLLPLSLWPEWVATPWRFVAGPRLWRGARSVLKRLARTPAAAPGHRLASKEISWSQRSGRSRGSVPAPPISTDRRGETGRTKVARRVVVLIAESCWRRAELHWAVRRGVPELWRRAGMRMAGSRKGLSYGAIFDIPGLT